MKQLIALMLLSFNCSALAFQFVPGKTCDSLSKLDPSFCEATLPKNWSEDEASVIEKRIKNLHSKELESFFNVIIDKGFNKFYRYSHSYYALPNGKFARAAHAAWVDYDFTINFSDLAFISNLPLDPIGKFDLQSSFLLHELVHAFALNNSKLMIDFQKLVGWKEVEGEWKLPNIDAVEVREVHQQMRKLVLQGKIEEGLRLDREFGIEHGFPSAYAMTNPDESLAEIVTHIYFDPNAKNYLRDDIIKWVQGNILKN